MPLIGREARGGIIAYVFVSRNDTPAPIKGILVKKNLDLTTGYHSGGCFQRCKDKNYFLINPQ